MTIHRDLLDVLVCPITKQNVTMLDSEKVASINALIKAGKIQSMDGNIVSEPLTEALITMNRRTIYRIKNGVPIMLESAGISADQLN